MFSFFTKKSQNPDNPVIQGPTQNNGGGAGDFIFVEKRGDHAPPQPQAQPMYPPMPYGAGAAYPRFPYGPPGVGSPKSAVQVPVSYVQGVPFELAPQLCTKTAFDNTQSQIDGILAFLTRQMSVDEQEEDYDFALERSIQNECY